MRFTYQFGTLLSVLLFLSQAGATAVWPIRYIFKESLFLGSGAMVRLQSDTLEDLSGYLRRLPDRQIGIFHGEDILVIFPTASAARRHVIRSWIERTRSQRLALASKFSNKKLYSSPSQVERVHTYFDLATSPLHLSDLVPFSTQQKLQLLFSLSDPQKDFYQIGPHLFHWADLKTKSGAGALLRTREIILNSTLSFHDTKINDQVALFLLNLPESVLKASLLEDWSLSMRWWVIEMFLHHYKWTHREVVLAALDRITQISWDVNARQDPDRALRIVYDISSNPSESTPTLLGLILNLEREDHRAQALPESGQTCKVLFFPRRHEGESSD